jgi:hypothetical protein
MAKKKPQGSIEKKDIQDARDLIVLHKQIATIRNRLCRRLKCDFYELDEWADRLAKIPKATDEDIAFAMGRLTYDEF